MSTYSNAARVDARIREVFDIKGDYSDQPDSGDPSDWPRLIIGLRDITPQVVEIKLHVSDVDCGRSVGVHVGVDADDDIDHLTEIGQTGHAFSPLPGRDVVPVRDGDSPGL